MKLSMAGAKRWTTVCWPTPEWAAQVYPEDGVERLFADVLSFCRLGPDDPPGTEGWDTHVARIGERGKALTEARLVRLELRAPGTRVSVDTGAIGGSGVGASQRASGAQLMFGSALLKRE